MLGFTVINFTRNSNSNSWEIHVTVSEKYILNIKRMRKLLYRVKHVIITSFYVTSAIKNIYLLLSEKSFLRVC